MWWGFDLRYPRDVCQQFDLMIEDFDVWEEERIHRTIEIPISDAERKAEKPTRQVRVFRTIRQVLGYDPIDDDLDIGDAGEADADPTGPMSAYEAGLLERMKSGELTDEERIRFGE